MGAIDTLKRILSPASGGSYGSIELQQVIEAGERKAAELVQARNTLNEQRANLLVDGTDADVDQVDAELATIHRDAERTEARLSELQRRLEEAKRREHAAAMDAAYKRALAHQAAEKVGVERYVELAGQVRDILLEIQAHSELRMAENEFLRAGGDTRKVKPASIALGRYSSVVTNECVLPDPNLGFGWKIWPIHYGHGAAGLLAAAREKAAAAAVE